MALNLKKNFFPKAIKILAFVFSFFLVALGLYGYIEEFDRLTVNVVILLSTITFSVTLALSTLKSRGKKHKDKNESESAIKSAERKIEEFTLHYYDQIPKVEEEREEIKESYYSEYDLFFDFSEKNECQNEMFSKVNSENNKNTEENNTQVWWDVNLFNKCASVFGEFDYTNEQGRIFIGKNWYVESPKEGKNTKRLIIKNVFDPVVREYQKTVEYLGGRVQDTLFASTSHVLYLSDEIDEETERRLSRYKSRIILKKDFLDIVEMAHSIANKNRSLFTPRAIFRIFSKALKMEEEEDGVKYVFCHKLRNSGVVGVYLQDDGSKGVIKWLGENVQEFIEEFGDIFKKRVIVMPSPRKTFIDSFFKKIKEEDEDNISLCYIDLLRWLKIFLAHDDEISPDVSDISEKIGMQRANTEEEKADLVEALFMIFVVDYLKDPSGLIDYAKS